MRGLELAALYLFIGVGLALAAYLRARVSGWADLGLLATLWPLYGPFVLMNRPQEADPGAPVGLEGRVDELARQLADIDGVLEQPDFQLEAAEQRRAEHADRGEARAAARVEARIASIQQLRRRREQLTEGLSEVRELMAQLRVQNTLVRVTGEADDGTRALVHELEARVEGLDALLSLDSGA